MCANARTCARPVVSYQLVNLDVELLQPPNSRHSLCAGHQTGSDWRPGGVDFSGLCTTMVRGAVGRLFVGLGPLLARPRGRGVPQGLSWCGARPPPPGGGCLRRRGRGTGGGEARRRCARGGAVPRREALRGAARHAALLTGGALYSARSLAARFFARRLRIATAACRGCGARHTARTRGCGSEHARKATSRNGRRWPGQRWLRVHAARTASLCPHCAVYFVVQVPRLHAGTRPQGATSRRRWAS